MYVSTDGMDSKVLRDVLANECTLQEVRLSTVPNSDVCNPWLLVVGVGYWNLLPGGDATKEALSSPCVPYPRLIRAQT